MRKPWICAAVATSFMLAGAAVSMFGWISSDLLGSPRMLFAFARDQIIPRVFGLINRAHRTPWAALVILAAFAPGKLRAAR